MKFRFEITAMTEMAQFVSELVRQGICFEVDHHSGFFEIILTGGF